MNKLTDSQRRIFHIIQDYMSAHKYAPTIREIGIRAGLRSSATIDYHLKHLKEKGYIEIKPKQRRAIKLLKDDKGNLLKQ